MKKIILILVCVFAAMLSSCKNTVNLEMYLSEVRHSVYKYQGEDYTVTVYLEEKESPYLSDGFVSEMKKYVTIKIEDYKSSLSDASIKLAYGDTEILGKFEYSPLNGKFTAQIEVSTLPSESEMTATVKNEGEEKSFILTKLNSSGKISYQTALDKVAYAKSDEIEKALSGGGTSIETRVRIISEGESVYYYVAIIDKTGKESAYLVDGYSGEILAEKTIS
ncbi:MAG: hypothetical protein J6V66_05405 [Clostridia bacterium]|nr:hypothetical protein [Clostridia bacterium]